MELECIFQLRLNSTFQRRDYAGFEGLKACLVMPSGKRYLNFLVFS